MSTIGDVARQAGVSTMTVSRVINNSGYISQATRERVERAVADLGYVRNALAASLHHKQTKTLALVLTDITTRFSPLSHAGLKIPQAKMASMSCSAIPTNRPAKRSSLSLIHI